MPARLFLPAALAAALLAGCVQSPEAYETTPVKVETPKGIVTCQLYTREIVVWDRAIDRPAKMGVQEADAICRAEGERQKAGG
jgi:type IV pilus biogenesis protein CpaD/CtpE